MDWEPYCGPDDIGVSVFERKQFDPTMERIVVGLTQDPETLYHRQVRMLKLFMFVISEV